MKNQDRRITLTPAETAVYETLLTAIKDAKPFDRNARTNEAKNFIALLHMKNGTLIPDGYEEPL